MSSKVISIRGAREHNLKAVDIDIPRDKLVVVTGLSGSGKSTLAFDTIYAEGQRKYVESLSAYARQFLDQLQKPDIESIEGLPPTIAIEQRSASHNPRSTVATTTEIYDYLRLLFARAGQPRCWHVDDKGQSCGQRIESQSATQIVDQIMGRANGSRLMLLAPIITGKKGNHKEILADMVRQGFVRARVNGTVIDLRKMGAADAPAPGNAPGNAPGSLPGNASENSGGAKLDQEKASGGVKLDRYKTHTIEAVVDRVILKDDPKGEIRGRVVESVELSLKLAEGLIVVSELVDKAKEQWDDTLYSEHYACADHPSCSLSGLEPRLFSFNSPYGACSSCSGLGIVLEVDPELVVPDPTLSLGDGAIQAWRNYGKRMSIYYGRLLRKFCRHFEVNPKTPFNKLSKSIRRILMDGSTERDKKKFGHTFEGVLPHLQRRWEDTDSEYVKNYLHNYLSEAPCENCCGARLQKPSLHVFMGSDWMVLDGSGQNIGHPRQFNIQDVTDLTIDQASGFFESLQLNDEQKQIAEPILKEVQARLGFMRSVGLGYLNLNRATGTLSGGEGQRIRLATQVGSGLVGCCYVLDEPTIGLHQRDNTRLIKTLRHLTDIGNTVIVVEHDEETIHAADYLIDVGPGPGRHGGTIVAKGQIKNLAACKKSITGQFLSGKRSISLPEQYRTLDHKHAITIKGATQNNLKNIDVAFPLGGLLCVTGVSGSGKSTLVNQILLRSIRRQLHNSRDKPGSHDRVANLKYIDRIIEVDQSPIGRTPRSNPATYTGVFDSLRKLFTQTREAKIRGYLPGRFSFNVKGGRCETCQGQGLKKIEMHFLPDVFVQCEVCQGKRYNRQTLEVTYRGKNIADVLAMTVEEAADFFQNIPDAHRMLSALNDVGLSYIQLGQSSITLSGGEAQRVKLASELGKRSTGHTMYVLDEPTTGLHFADVEKLLSVLHRLADGGNTVIVIEHNLDVIKNADWILDLGPEGGDRGGTLLAQGTPPQIVDCPESFTGQHLAHLLKATVTA